MDGGNCASIGDRCGSPAVHCRERRGSHRGVRGAGCCSTAAAYGRSQTAADVHWKARARPSAYAAARLLRGFQPAGTLRQARYAGRSFEGFAEAQSRRGGAVPEHVTGDTDALAAEYVLGTLEFDERSAAESLRAQDAEFAAKVKVWERRLGELHLMVEPVDPDPDIWQRIKAKLPALPRPQPSIPIPELTPEPVPDRVPE